MSMAEAQAAFELNKIHACQPKHNMVGDYRQGRKDGI